ncbi:MAG: nitroreductase family protein [Sphingomonas sp.]|uniref:nitroreductase family protein n=1 Tax=unclassified Sphingomonas TaxID=196159 RepID=UPI0024575B5B|nr:MULTISPECIES: nitroreductase family protein [unclassified Sphingomonas]MBQ1497458.1 nitroreductase family protein [Sphingomonas sp.]MDH4745254.1 nitroreductase family protein [Sphingomonas sp. CBMAI 2297]
MAEHEALPWQPYPELSDDVRIARARAFLAEIALRRSCRAFDERPVPREVIEAALRAAGSAPSGANRQPWHFCAIEGAEAKATIRVAAEEEERQFYGNRAPGSWLDAVRPLGTGADKPFLEAAPWLIAVFARRLADEEAVPRNYYVTESVGIATGILLATLHAAGVATLVHTPRPMRFLNRVCRRPDSEKALMLIVAGHPAAGATIPVAGSRKKPLEEISSWL